jgi:hypothetical protein
VPPKIEHDMKRRGMDLEHQLQSEIPLPIQDHKYRQMWILDREPFLWICNKTQPHTDLQRKPRRMGEIDVVVADGSAM